MSLQNVVLPEVVVADLFKKIPLMSPQTATNTSVDNRATESNGTVKFLGSNLKNIAIVVKHPDEVFLPDRHLEFLSRILSACRLNLGDVAIINEGYRYVDINKIRQDCSPANILLFGVEPTELKLPMTFPHFKLQPYADAVYLAVPSLDVLNADTDEGKLLKTRLWVCLKSMFGVEGAK